MSCKTENRLILGCILFLINCVQGVPVPIPKPQVLPGQIPPHLASHPALSSITQGRESAIMQYAYNIQNRRGPSPSPLVLQNNQERNLQLANQFSHRRSGQQAFIPSNGVHGQGGNGYSQGNENPENRALDLLQKYKGQDGQQQQQNSYNPAPLTPSHVHGHDHSHYHQPGVGPGPSAVPPGDENEGEDIRRLKSLLNLTGRPIGGSQNPNYAVAPGSATIGVAGQRGVLNPAQYGQHPSHDHHHPTPIPATAQSRNSLGNLQYGNSPTPYPGSRGPTSGPSLVHVPYSTDPHHGHSHDHHQPGQGIHNHYDYNNLNYNSHNPYDQYRHSRPSDYQQIRPNEIHHYRPDSRDYHNHQYRPGSRDYHSQQYRQNSNYPEHQHHERNEFDRYRPSNSRYSYRK